MHKPKFSGGETYKRHLELISAHQKAFAIWQANRDIEWSDLRKQLELAGFVIAPKTVSNWHMRFNRGVFPRKGESKRASPPSTLICCPECGTLYSVPSPLGSAEEIVNAYIAVLDKVREENRMFKEQVKTLNIEVGVLKARCDLAETRIREDYRVKLSKALAEPGEG